MQPLKKNEKIMLGVIGAALVLFVAMDPYYFIWKDTPMPESEKKAVKVDTVAHIPEFQAQNPVKRHNYQRAGFKGWGRDPFLQTKRSLEMSASIGEMKLTGISVSGNDRFALINSRILREGDTIEGMLVSKIYANRVIMSLDGRSFTLNWGNR